MSVMFHVYISQITALTCRPVNSYELRNAKYCSNWKKKFENSGVKVISWFQSARYLEKENVHVGHFWFLNSLLGSSRYYLGKTGLAKIIAHLTNSSPFKKRFFEQIPRVKSWLSRNKSQRDWIGALKRLNCLSQRSLADEHYSLLRALPLASEKTSGIQGITIQ